jgi:hypothetical protein
MLAQLQKSLLQRLKNTLDATTQLLNCLLLPSPFDTNANESISGRMYREGRRVPRNLIDWFFLKVFGEENHCYNSFISDLRRAEALIKSHGHYLERDDAA